jgi:CheY-like chemotaxis protein
VNSQPLSILYVDDHADTCRAISRLLTLLGHDVTTAGSVRGALEVATEKDFHLLISDIGLPDGTGHALLQELVAKGPILGIALSGYSDEVDVQKSIQGGFIEHLVKPVTADQLESAIERIRRKVLP